MTEVAKARLENWYIGGPYLGQFVKPTDTSLADAVLYGNVYDHVARPDLRDGEFVRTSYIVDSDVKAGWVQTRNTLYTLGKMSPEYEKFCNETEQVKETV